MPATALVVPSGEPLCTRISYGTSAPLPMPESFIAVSPSLASPALAIVSRFERPGFMFDAATTRAPSTTSATIADAQRRLTTASAQRVQARDALSSVRRCGQSSREPSECRITGSRVSATTTLTSGISMPPIPTLRRNGSGSATSASRPIATVVPEKTTARPAVSIARTIASSPSCPWARSSRQRTATISE